MKEALFMIEHITSFLFAATNGLMWGALIALIACGLSIVFTFLSIINLAHGDFYMLGAVIAFYVITITHSFWIALVVAPTIVGCLAIVFFWFFLRNQNGQTNKYLLATFGLSLILQNLVLLIFGGYPVKIDSPITYTITLFGNTYPVYRLFVAFFSITIFTLYLLFIEKTKFGLWLRATGANFALATALGIPTKLVYSLAFGLGGFFAGLAGVLVSPIISIEYRMGNDVLLLAFIVTILGGFGNVLGTFIASLLYGTIEGILIAATSPLIARTTLIGLCCIFILVKKTGFSPIAKINSRV